MAMITVRRAVAPVAHALDTLYTGMPVWPICFCTCWPMPELAWNRVPHDRMSMSEMVTPPSSSAPKAAVVAKSTASWSG